jgi:hypothetical protein
MFVVYCLAYHEGINKNNKILMEERGIEPRAFHMQSERSTTELHPR